MNIGDLGLGLQGAGLLLVCIYGAPLSRDTRPEHRKFAWAGWLIVFAGFALQGWDRFA